MLLIKYYNRELYFFELTITSKHNLLNFGTSFINKLLPSLNNNFWKSTLNAWIKYVSINQPTKLEHKLTMPLWYNPVLLNDSLV